MKINYTKKSPRRRVLPRGYRWLEEGEIKRKGDRWPRYNGREWGTTTNIGQVVYARRFYIRKKP